MTLFKAIAVAALLAASTYAAPFGSAEALESREVSSAFHVPAGQGNGVYSVTIDEKGNHVHTKLYAHVDPPKAFVDAWMKKHTRDVALDDEAPTNETILMARGDYGVRCASNAAIMDQLEVMRAAYNLGLACDNGGSRFIPVQGSQYSLSGNANVFACNYAKNPLLGTKAIGCSTDAVINDIQAIEDPKGCNYKEGWYVRYNILGSKRSYGYVRAGNSFCSSEPDGPGN